MNKKYSETNTMADLEDLDDSELRKKILYQTKLILTVCLRDIVQ